MKAVSKISLCLSIVFVALIFSLSVAASFLNIYVIIGRFSTAEILAILTALGVISFSVFLFSVYGFKTASSIVPVAFFVAAEVILLVVTFLPKYNYAKFTTNDSLHTVVVQEKESFTNTSLQIYKKNSGIFYRSVYIAGIEGDSQKKHQFGNYSLSFEDEKIRLHAPTFSSTPILISCSK